MKVCVYGAGAIGGLFAAQLSASGQPVTVIARGKALAELERNGIGLKSGSDCRFYPVQVKASANEAGMQDLIIISVKQPDLNAILHHITPMLGPKTKVLLAMNGVPWWFLEGQIENSNLQTLDPDNCLSDLLPTNHIIGCVVHLACTSASPGICELKGGNHLIIGQPDGLHSKDLQAIAEMLISAGFDVSQTNNIRAEIWYKLWGNMTMNPISALTRSTTDQILDDGLVNTFCCQLMREASQIGSKIDCGIDQSPEQRNSATRALGPIRTSMLQDVEKGKALEYEALIGAVYELSEKLGVDAPNLSILYGLIRLLARSNSYQ